MMQRIYAVFDRVAETAVGGLMLFPGDPSAVRTFLDLVADPKTQVGQHPRDYDLICVGTYDMQRCAVVGHEQPVTVLTGAAADAARSPSGGE